jgi:hypothetical protein
VIIFKPPAMPEIHGVEAEACTEVERSLVDSHELPQPTVMESSP